MISVNLINAMDTVTNLVFLLVVLTVPYAFIFNTAFAELPIIRSPLVKVTRNALGSIVVIRNPLSGAWLFTLNVSNNVPRPSLKPVGMVIRFSVLLLTVLGLMACGPTEATKDTGVNNLGPKGVCIETVPAIADTLIKGMAKYDLQVSAKENLRNRCYMADDGVICHSKVRGDTLYIVDTYCPATLKAKAEMGGN